MAWLKNILGKKNNASAEDVVQFYQEMGFFDGTAPSEVVAEYSASHGKSPNPNKPWDDDWIDLDVLRQLNAEIAQSGRQFAYAVDVNHSVVVCLTSEQKDRMSQQRKFPFAW